MNDPSTPPDFTVIDQAGSPWALSDHMDAAVVLVFLRGDWWPYCNGQLVSLAERHPEILALGARVFAIDVDSPAQHAAMIEKLRLPFPMLSDEDRSAVIAPWGLANPNDKRNLAYAAVVVIDPEGAEVFRWESHEYAFRIPEDDVIEVVAALGLDPTEQDAPLPGIAEAGPGAVPLEALVPYLRGARFAAIAFGNRHPDIRDEVSEFVAQVDRYSEGIRNLRARIRADEDER